MEYKARSGACAACVLRPQCTRAKFGRTLKRHEKQAALDIARRQAHSHAARRDRKRRQQLMEQSFADAANNHHFKRARWRRLWRQQIQDYLIAAIQNVRILLAHKDPKRVPRAISLLPVILGKACFIRRVATSHRSVDLSYLSRFPIPSLPNESLTT